MAGSFFALLDDIAVLARATAASLDDIGILTKAAASSIDDIGVFSRAVVTSADDIVAGASKAASKTAAVLIDDTAVTPQYLKGISPSRELPIVWRIARGSLINKAIIIAAVMLLSIWAPWVFPWALILGGAYLAFEGAEKVLHYLESRRGKDIQTAAQEALERSPQDENAIVRSAVTTDLVLSAEIMLISMSNLESDLWWMRLGMLILVGLLMTGLVYGSVGLLIKVDDIGLWTAARGVLRKSIFLQKLGAGLIKLMPVVFNLLTIVGTAAMLWVGGHLLLVNLSEVGLAAPLELVERITHPISNGLLLWLSDAAFSAVVGIAAGLVIAAGLKFATDLVKNEA